MSLFADFPDLGGPYSVGCHDIEWHVGSKKGPQSFPVSSLLIRLFYPANVTKHDRRACWVSNQEYARALCKDVAHMPGIVADWLSALAKRIKIRASADAPLLKPPKNTSGYPIIIFSHGLGGNRHLYSSFCSSMASYGFVVAAIEHRDGSGSLAKGHGEDDWIRYDGLPPEVWDYRHVQLQRRLAEVQLCVDAMERLNLGTMKQSKATSGFRGSLDLDSMVMAGHSFGAATAILALNHPKTQFKCGILLDPWTQPLVMMDRLCTIYRPVLAILSEQFAFWPDNFDTVQELMQSSPCCNRSICFSLTGTAHTHQSDVMLVLRHLIRFDFRSPFQIDPALAIDLNSKAAVAFIRHALAPEASGKLDLHQDVLSYYKQYPNHIVVHVPYLSTPRDLERFSPSIHEEEEKV
ncbi:platelet-activating factor acetylhydrolase-like [Lichtheimia corymbifera JMRC:FSU:9682]|uniref:Putative phospholipase n=1 Tax=Lichtheimia corymbifera JMRC:FSU:9682 TaxID=1263082 RepID=A0A068S096_9FUNG|nr:platelet-activating factor acetylhydrolase-like [Lichtheimia corymbifera JMRC:FSU:9682]